MIQQSHFKGGLLLITLILGLVASNSINEIPVEPSDLNVFVDEVFQPDLYNGYTVIVGVIYGNNR